ncbi:YwiC-like family protein [Alkalicoccus daliensis]|uniref:YwiC-like protein n=1 Tax=Alkalicoccus daliensis TaxID=745820 RepID=A0A1H0IS57_9BACI|nr:YwiC-like family protein [Alkalicoccus daliensis]SDO33871.1 YwiC-like protein [Alkalicoccus daliensis]
MFSFHKPRQHGAWAMLFMPLFFSYAVTTVEWLHVIFLAAWFIVFLFSEHFLFWLKKPAKRTSYLNTSLLLLLGAGLMLLIVFFFYPGILLLFFAMLPFLGVSIWFTMSKKERHILNDISGIIIFSLGGMASAYIGSGNFYWISFFLPLLFFAGSAFYVKTMIREKKSSFYRNLSFGYHSIIVMILFLWHPILGLAMIPSLVRALFLWGRSMTPKKVGILEIINTIFALICFTIYVTT